MFSSTITPQPDAIFSPITFGRSINNEYQAVDPATVFQNPIRKIVAVFSYINMIPGVQWTALWYHDGILVHYETLPWDGTTGGYGLAVWEPDDPSQWIPGNYEVQIFVGHEWKVVGRFIIEGDPPTPAPSATPSLTPLPSRTPLPTETRWNTLTPTP
jgi:type VI secretion system secreted protein VgrG